MKKRCAVLLIAAMLCMMLTACGKEDGMTKVKLTEDMSVKAWFGNLLMEPCLSKLSIMITF